MSAVKVLRLKLEVGVELGDGLPKGIAVPNDLAYSCLTVGLQSAFEGGGNDGHGAQRDMVLADPLQIGPLATTVF